MTAPGAPALGPRAPGMLTATALALSLLMCSAVADTPGGGTGPATGPAGGAGNSASRRFLTEFLQEPPAVADAPQFDLSVPSNLTGLVGQPVRLLCRVRALGNRTVSWMRHRDTHLLTVGRYTYTSDQRFEAQHSPHSEEWALRIRPAQRRDSGTYECQVSTTPPIGHHVFLSVVEPETEILGGPELFINLGSTINLTCLVRHAPEPPPSITWSHGDQVINFDSARGGISLVTEKGAASSSRLLVQRAGPRDSGHYTCAPSNAPPATVRVHILNGEHPAAMHGEAAPSASCCLLRACLLLHLLLLLLRRRARPPLLYLPPPERPLRTK